MSPMETFSLKWDTSAAHYLAIKSAENGKEEKLQFYLNYISSHTSKNELQILPLFDDKSIQSKMIKEIIEDDTK